MLFDLVATTSRAYALVQESVNNQKSEMAKLEGKNSTIDGLNRQILKLTSELAKRG